MSTVYRRMIAVYAEHTRMAGRLVPDHDPDCESDDHVHLSYETPGMILRLAESLEAQNTAYGSRVAQSIREELEAAGEMPEGEEPLRSTIDSPEVREEVEALARPDVVYEHGQWWVKTCGVTFAVVDTDTGLDLEQC